MDVNVKHWLNNVLTTGVVSFYTLIPNHAASQGIDTTANFRQIVEKVVMEIPPGWVALFSNPDTIWVGAGGFSELRIHKPMQTDMKFRIASNTKQLVSIIVLQLMEEGKLKLDDTVEKYLPGLLPNGNEITIRQLLNHTSGIFTFNMDIWYGIRGKLNLNSKKAISPERCVKIALRHKPYFKPGEPGKWHYSNTNYTILGLIIEKLEGKPLHQILNERIFFPLHMMQTYLPSGDSVLLQEPYAHGYAKNKKRAKDQSVLHPSRGWASGGVIATAEDLLKYTNAYMSGNLLKDSSMKEMLKVANPQGDSISGYGLGLYINKIPNGGRMIFHSGSIRGYVSFIYMFPEKKTTIVLLFNMFSNEMRKANYGQIIQGFMKYAETLKSRN